MGRPFSLKSAIERTGAEWVGVQDSIPPAPSLIVFINSSTKHQLSIPYNPDADFETVVQTVHYVILKDSGRIFEEKKMTLKEKLHTIYASIDLIEKRGYNKVQSYKYIRSADVTNAIRKRLTEHRVYAEINFSFEGAAYTIARVKDKDTPFTAVNVRCTISFHDLDSGEFLTSSGLGTGADTGDKAAYKAQTGALKYALKNAFLVPDEEDPEADETVDEVSTRQIHEEPDFQDARRGTPAPAHRPTQQAVPTRPPNGEPIKPITVDIPTASAPSSAPTVAAPSTPSPSIVPAAAREAQTPQEFVQEVAAEPRQPGDEPDSAPTEAELAEYRKRFTKLGDDLTTGGKLKASKGLPVNRKLLAFLLSVTKAPKAANISKAGWEKFFRQIDLTQEQKGLVYLAEVVNKANGIEDTKKK